ncbi:hypothetical protein C5167_034051 [Papaver somniferum]|uniref:Uncharacterized protein n=1 Tax=Papaver somniferum TaxID=3469 RepID=A0A4Y7KEU0_PAPSO|nr:hypothetical protein C5167_034051 [Papaver somniferum]
MLPGSSNSIDAMNDLERQLHEYFMKVKSLIKVGNLVGAIDLLRANYNAVKKQIDTGVKGIEQAAMLDVIALGYMAVGDLEYVEYLLEMSSPYLVTPLLGMAKVYTSIRRASKAVEVYNRAITIIETSRGAESEDVVMPLLGLGNLLIKEGKAADAQHSFDRILRIYTNLYGESDGRVGVAMCSLAHALCAEGDVDEAIRLYKNGIKVVNDSKFLALDDELVEKMRIDLAELLHRRRRATAVRGVLADN